MAKIKMIKGQSFIFKKDIFAPKMKIFFFFFYKPKKKNNNDKELTFFHFEESQNRFGCNLKIKVYFHTIIRFFFFFFFFLPMLTMKFLRKCCFPLEVWKSWKKSLIISISWVELIEHFNLVRSFSFVCFITKKLFLGWRFSLSRFFFFFPFFYLIFIILKKKKTIFFPSKKKRTKKKKKNPKKNDRTTKKKTNKIFLFIW